MDTGDAKADALSWVIQPFGLLRAEGTSSSHLGFLGLVRASSSALSLCLYGKKTNSQLWIYKVIRCKTWVRIVPVWLDLEWATV